MLWRELWYRNIKNEIDNAVLLKDLKNGHIRLNCEALMETIEKYRGEKKLGFIMDYCEDIGVHLNAKKYDEIEITLGQVMLGNRDWKVSVIGTTKEKDAPTLTLKHPAMFLSLIGGYFKSVTAPETTLITHKLATDLNRQPAKAVTEATTGNQILPKETAELKNVLMTSHAHSY